MSKLLSIREFARQAHTYHEQIRRDIKLGKVKTKEYMKKIVGIPESELKKYL